MDKPMIMSIRNFRSGLYEDIEECIRLKKVFYEDFDNSLSFKKLMTLTLKHKIVNDFLSIFNTIIRGKGKLEGQDKLTVLNIMKRITQRVKIQLAQMKKLGPLLNQADAHKVNEIYYKKLLSAVYSVILR
ncbi:hypothetical protein [Chrysochromulina parva virophage Curly]|jgi:hypothetical protein|nr:hypothetical protein [Chrysochromulina parva virophage Curly]